MIKKVPQYYEWMDVKVDCGELKHYCVYCQKYLESKKTRVLENHATSKYHDDRTPDENGHTQIELLRDIMILMMGSEFNEHCTI